MWDEHESVCSLLASFRLHLDAAVTAPYTSHRPVLSLASLGLILATAKLFSDGVPIDSIAVCTAWCGVIDTRKCTHLSERARLCKLVRRRHAQHAPARC